jgi:hypothetical protein
MLYLAEFYLPARGTPLADVAGHARAAADRLTQAGLAVSFVRAIHVAQDESCFAVYLAGSKDAVIAAGAAAGLEFDSVAEATEIS